MTEKSKSGKKSRRGMATDYGWRLQPHTRAWRPPTDILEKEDAYLVVVEVAGMRGSEFSVTCDGQVLAVRGVRPEGEQVKAYHQMEITYGEFVTELELPAPVNTEAIKATYADGFLRIVLPKARSTSIPIED
jgi:HSP20 family protein